MRRSPAGRSEQAGRESASVDCQAAGAPQAQWRTAAWWPVFEPVALRSSLPPAARMDRVWNRQGLHGRAPYFLATGVGGMMGTRHSATTPTIAMKAKASA